jgi:hypothetical protein
MDFKKIILSDASAEAKVSAIALLLNKELPKLVNKVDSVKKLKGEQGDRGLQGDKGDAGKNGKDGKDGKNGSDGSTGKNGKDGDDGVSVVNAKVDFDDTLVLTLSTGKEINVGEVKGDKGDNGRDGNTGANGIGVPTGGTSGQVLAKNSGADYDTRWITNSASGTVTNVAASVPTGLSVSGSPITTTGTLSFTYTAGYSIPTTSSQTNWDTAYTDRLKWDGGSTGLVAATGRTSLGLVIGTDVLAPTGSAATLTSFPTFNQNTTGSAATLTTARAIYGNNFDGSAALTQIIASTYGGTGNGFTKFSGPTTTERTFTLPDATATILTSNAAVTPAQGGTGVANNASSTITISGAFGTTLTVSGTTSVTLPTSGTLATLAGTETFTNKRVDPRVTSAASASTLTPSIATADVYAYTALAAGLTINAPTGTPVDGDKLIFRILDNGTARALTWNATYTVIGVTLPTTTTISKTTYVGCIYNANNTRWDVIAVATQA